MAETTRDGLSEHPDTESLLNYLDKDGESDCRLHILGCGYCQAELEHLQDIRRAVQELPQLRPPADLWHKINKQGRRRLQLKPFFSYQSAGWLAMAASVLLVATVVLIQLPTQDTPGNPVLAALIEENRQLEAALERLENQPAVMRLDTIGQIAQLKDSVSTVDLVFDSQFDNPEGESKRIDLLEKRIHLMRELVETRAQPMLAYSDNYRAF